MDWKITIKKVNNGYIVEGPGGDMKEISVIEEISDDDEKEACKRLLEFVAEHFGFMHDKFAEDNLRISWDKKGRKIED